jgi:hypothetical protein
MAATEHRSGFEEMDAGGGAAVLIHPPGWDPNCIEIALSTVSPNPVPSMAAISRS